MQGPLKLKLFRQNKKYKTKIENSSKDFSTFLDTELENVKCLRDAGWTQLNWPESVRSDRKMYIEKAYVLITQNNSNLTRKRRSRFKKDPEIIISDSDTDSVKTPLKLSFKLPPKKHSPHSNVSEPIKVTCAVCDKDFFSSCNYKSHCLWHEKPEHIQIDLVRYELPYQTKVSEFPSVLNKRLKPLVPSEHDINKILSKYIDKLGNDGSVSPDNKVQDEPMNLCNGDNSKPTVSDYKRVEDSANFTENPEKLLNRNESEEMSDNPEIENATELLKQQEDTTHVLNNNIQNTDNSEENDESHKNCNPDIDKVLQQVDENECINAQEPIDDSENNRDLSNGKSDDPRCISDDTLHHEDEISENESAEGRKRKQIRSPVSSGYSDDQSTGGENTPTIKKVRFAIDYSCPGKSKDIIVPMEESTQNDSEHLPGLEDPNDDYQKV